VTEKIVLTVEDFVDADFIMIRPRLVRKFGGDVHSVLMIARIQFRCQVQTPDEDGIRWWTATYPELSEETGLSPQAAKRTIDKLVGQKVVLAKIDNLNKWDRSRSYRVDIGPVVHLSIPEDASLEIDRSISRNRQIDVPKSTDPLSTKEAKEEDQEQTPPQPPAAGTHASTPSPDRFDEFWAAYPRREAKGAARTAWAKAIKKIDPDCLITAATAYRNYSGRSPQFTKHAASWLNQECWLDERTPVTAGANDYQPYQDPDDFSDYDRNIA
jgi:hypothetical protein